MKKTQRKDLFRNVRRQWVSFVSIVIITILGVIAFLGIDYSTMSLRKNGSDYYNQLNFRDIEVISTLLLTEEDLTSLRGVEGVADAEAVRFMSGNASFEDKSENISVISVTERINRVAVLEGRMPTGMTECAVEQPLTETMGLRVGDVITLSARGDSANYLKNNQFTVVGIVSHPDHINTNVKEPFYAVTTNDAFDSKLLDHCFMKAELAIEKPEGINRFSEQYETAVARVLKSVDALAASRAELRDTQLKSDAAEQINTAKLQLESGFSQLEDAKSTMRNTLREVVEVIFKEDAEREMFHWASEQTPDVNDPNETARYLWLTENIRMDLSHTVTEMFRTVIYSESIPDNQLVVIYEFTHEENAPRIGDGTAYDMDAVRAGVMEKVSVYAENFDKLSKSCTAWDEGHTRYIEGLATYREKMDAWQSCRWLAFNARGNASFSQMTIASENLANLKLTFSLMFVCVGVLVILATVGKMVDEQRGLVGTEKALGFFYREIFAKYLCFGLLATVTGLFLGILVSRFAIGPYLLSTFVSYYRFDASGVHLDVIPTVIACAAGVLLTTVTIWLTCRKLLREPAIRLLQPKEPNVKKSSGRVGRRILPLYSRLILLNMRTDFKRVVVTIVSVAGCCALMIIGMTLRSAVNGSLVKQYSEVVAYDEYVTYNPNDVIDDGREFRETLQAAGAAYTDIYANSTTYRFTNLHVAELFCGDLNEIHKFFRLSDWKTGEPLTVATNGVLIPRRTAEVYGLDVGSEMEIAIGGTQTASVRVAGVFENYIGTTLVMSGDYYEKIYGGTLQPNAFMVNLNGADAEKLNDRLQDLNGYETTTRSDVSRTIIETSSASLKSAVWLFIGIAAVMAGVVQLNLTNMYVIQKKRELTVMRINGFTTGEVIGYMARETVFTTLVGILIGSVAGAGLAYKVLRTLEQPIVQFKREVDVIALLLAAALTVLFTTVVNAVALRKVKKLKLTDLS